MHPNATNKNKSKVICPELSYKITGLLFKVHNELGRYRNEKQYTDRLEQLLKDDKIIYKREGTLPRSFKGEKINRNISDFIIDNKIIVDIKAKRWITKDDYFQMKRYLASSKKELGIIVNFRSKYINPKRILNSEIQ